MYFDSMFLVATQYKRSEQKTEKHFLINLPKQDKTQKHRRALPYDQVSSCIDAVQRSRASGSTKLEILLGTPNRSSASSVRGKAASDDAVENATSTGSRT